MTPKQARNCMSKMRPRKHIRKIAIDPNPKGDLKALGGAKYEDWNYWLAAATAGALPVNPNDEDSAPELRAADWGSVQPGHDEEHHDRAEHQPATCRRP